MPMIELESSDGEVSNVDVEVAECSTTIETMQDSLGVKEDEKAVPLPNVNSPISRKIIEWATYHKDDPLPPGDDKNREKRTDDISFWDADFFGVRIPKAPATISNEVDQGTLFELLMAANHLDMKGLYKATCSTVVNMIKGKTPKEIRKTFNIENNFTASEKEQVREEN